MAERSLVVSGDIDVATAAAIQDRLLVLVDATDDDLVLDCTHLGFIDSMGIALFVHTQRLLEVQGRGFRVTNLRGIARRAFENLGLIDVLGIEPEAQRA
jgi:anti-anti-sigma factor